MRAARVPIFARLVTALCRVLIELPVRTNSESPSILPQVSLSHKFTRKASFSPPKSPQRSELRDKSRLKTPFLAFNTTKSSAEPWHSVLSTPGYVLWRWRVVLNE